MGWRQRLTARLHELGLTRAEVARRAGVGPTALRDILDRGQTPSVENLSKIARSLGVSLSYLYEGDSNVKLILTINGISQGRGMWSEVPRRHAKVVPLSFFNDEMVTVEVSDDDLAPNYRRGDIIAGPRSSGDTLSNLIGSDCIIETKSGRRTVCILMHGSKPGRYNLRSFDLRKDEQRDVEVEWAAPIRLILRGSQ